MLARHGKTPIAWLSDLGVLGPNAILGHAIVIGGSSIVANRISGLEMTVSPGLAGLTTLTACAAVNGR